MEQKILRTITYNHGEIKDAPSFTEEDIFTQLSTFKTGKALGLDGIDANIIQGSWPVLNNICLARVNSCLTIVSRKDTMVLPGQMETRQNSDDFKKQGQG